jgi:hypothetical protein
MEILAIFKPGHIQQALIYKAPDGYVGWINIDPSDKDNQALVDNMLQHIDLNVIYKGNIVNEVAKYS